MSCCGRAAKPNLDEVFASLTGQRIGGLIVSTDPFIYDQRDRIIASAAMIEIVSGDADLLSAAELLAYPSRECARGPHEVQIFPYFLHKNPLQRRRVDIAIDANPTPALQLDLDQPRFLAPPSTWCAIDRGRLPFALHWREGASNSRSRRKGEAVPRPAAWIFVRDPIVHLPLRSTAVRD